MPQTKFWLHHWPYSTSSSSLSRADRSKSIFQISLHAPPPTGGVQSEVTEDADVSEFLAIAVGVEAEEESPLESHETPDTRQVEARGVRGHFSLGDGQGEEGGECSNSQEAEEGANNHEEPEALEPGAPIVLQVHYMGHQAPQRQNTR